jgi:pimeloyl-ACP methyl ester carboxylesterase
LRLPGGDLQVRVDGPRRAPALVLLHGFDASIRWWQPSMAALARGHRVVRIDLLGHGGSAKPRDGYSMGNQSRLVAVALRRIGVRRAIVAGHSMGGRVAVALAEAHPGVVRGIVLVDSPARHDQAQLGFTGQLGFYPLIGPAFRRLATDSVIYDGMKVGFAPGFKFPRSLIQDNRRMTYSSFDKAGAASDDYVKQRSLDRRLTSTGKPVLVLFGTREQIVKAGAWRSYRGVPRATIRLIGGAGHSPMFEKPRPTTRHILAFARRAEGTGA